MTLPPIYIHCPNGHNYNIADLHTVLGMLVLSNGREFDTDCPTDLYVGTQCVGRYTARQLIGKIEKFKEILPKAERFARNRQSDMHALGVIMINSGNTYRETSPYRDEIAKIAKEIFNT